MADQFNDNEDYTGPPLIDYDEEELALDPDWLPLVVLEDADARSSTGSASEPSWVDEEEWEASAWCQCCGVITDAERRQHFFELGMERPMPSPDPNFWWLCTSTYCIQVDQIMMYRQMLMPLGRTWYRIFRDMPINGRHNQYVVMPRPPLVNRDLVLEFNMLMQIFYLHLVEIF